MMALRRTAVCGETKFVADITIIFSEIHIQLDSYYLVENNLGERQKVEDVEATKEPPKAEPNIDVVTYVPPCRTHLIHHSWLLRTQWALRR